MPSSLEISQTRYTVPGLRRVGGRAPARHAGARPLTPVLRHTTSSASGAGRRIVPRATVPPPLRQHRQSLASLAAPDGLAAAAAARPPQARPHAHAHASARAACRRAALTARRRPPSRAIAV